MVNAGRCVGVRPCGGFLLMPVWGVWLLGAGADGVGAQGDPAPDDADEHGQRGGGGGGGWGGRP